MNDGKIEYEIDLGYNGNGGDAALNHVSRIKSAYMGLNQLLRGDLVGAFNSLNNATKGFSASLSSALKGATGVGAALLAGWNVGKALDRTFGISDKIAEAIVPAGHFNSELRTSLAALQALNAAKLDAVTKDLSAMGEEAKKASDHARNLIDLKNQANIAKATTPDEQYHATQSASIDTLRQMESDRETLSSLGKTLTAERNRRVERGLRNELWQEAAVERKDSSTVVGYYRKEKESAQTSANEMIPAMLANKQALEILAGKMEVVGANITKASREKAEEQAQAENDRLNKRDGAEKAAYTLEEDSKAEARKKRLDIESQYNYQRKYDPLSDEDKLKVTQENIRTGRKKYTGATTEQDKLSAAEGLIEQGQIRDTLQKRIAAAAADKTKDSQKAAEDRAAKIQSARDNIAGASKRSVGGDDLAGYFQRTSDLRHGRAPKDDAAMQTAENTRIIAENTKALAALGIVKP